MALLQTEGFILNCKNVGDADRLITFLSIDQGMMKLFARNVRRAKSPLSGLLQPFVHAAIFYTQGKSFSLRQCTMIEPFHLLREDLTIMAYASVVAELVIQFWPEGEGAGGLFEFVAQVFHVIGEKNPRLVALAASWQLLAMAGFAPELTVCVHCGNQVALHDTYLFSPSTGGVCCTKCATAEAAELPSSTFLLLKKLITLDWKHPDPFTVTGSDLMQVEKIFLDYLLCHSDQPLKSLAFIHSIA